MAPTYVRVNDSVQAVQWDGTPGALNEIAFMIGTMGLNRKIRLSPMTPSCAGMCVLNRPVYIYSENSREELAVDKTCWIIKHGFFGKSNLEVLGNHEFKNRYIKV